jgi:hypothetical protein
MSIGKSKVTDRQREAGIPKAFPMDGGRMHPLYSAAVAGAMQLQAVVRLKTAIIRRAFDRPRLSSVKNMPLAASGRMPRRVQNFASQVVYAVAPYICEFRDRSNILSSGLQPFLGK